MLQSPHKVPVFPHISPGTTPLGEADDKRIILEESAHLLIYPEYQFRGDIYSERLRNTGQCAKFFDEMSLQTLVRTGKFMFTEQGQFLFSQNAPLAFTGAIAAAACVLGVEADIRVFLRKRRKFRTIDVFLQM